MLASLNARTVASKVAVSGITLRRVPAWNSPDRDHHRVEDVELPGDHRLQRDHHLRRDHDRVGGTACGREACPPTPRTVTNRPADAAISGPLRVANTPRGRMLENTCSPYAADDPRPGRVQHSLGEHRGGAVVTLLARLEHEHHVARQLGPVAAEQDRRPDQGRGVQVVAAGVHHPGRRREGLARSPRSPAGRPGRPAAARPERAPDAAPRSTPTTEVSARPRVSSSGSVGEGVGDQGLCTRQLQPDLGCGVQVPAQRSEATGQSGRLVAQSGDDG